MILDLILNIMLIVSFVLALIACVLVSLAERQWRKKVWSVTVDGNEYFAVTALDFSTYRSYPLVSFFSLEDGCNYRLTYSELSYCELVPCDEKNGNVAVFEEKKNEDR